MNGGDLAPWFCRPRSAGASGGTKLRGLAALPDTWVPPFLAVSGHLAHKLSRGQWPAAVSTAAGEAAVAAVAGTQRFLIVRSDATDEAARPGEAVSRIVPARWDELSAALVDHVETYGAESRPIVQRLVNPAMLGAASNERHLTSSLGTWVIEGWPHRDHAVVRRLRAQRDGIRRSGPLHAPTLRDLWRCLRVACGRIGAPNETVRCEWAWDGRRLWILQADKQTVPESDPVVAALLERRERSPRPRAVRRHSAETLLDSPKLESRRLFARMGWRTVDIAVLTVDDFGRGPEPLSRALADVVDTFGGGPVVVRTDIQRHGDRLAHALLPTSRPEREPEALRAFVVDTLETITTEGVDNDDVLFLVSPLIHARASAMALGAPGRAGVQVDALWGFPDGLLALPHDTYHVDIGATPRVIERRRAYKPACLVLREGERRYARLGAPWDWASVLERNEIQTIAACAKHLADELGRSVQLMCLIDSAPPRGVGACLPFHLTALDVPTSSTQRPPRRSVAEVRNWNDLERLRSAPPAELEGIALRPQPGADRDSRLLSAVAQLAHEHDAVVDFQGSVLGHAYYILRSHGAIVSRSQGPATDVGRLAAVEERPGVLRVRTIPADDRKDGAPQLKNRWADAPSAWRTLSFVRAQDLQGPVGGFAGEPTQFSLP